MSTIAKAEAESKPNNDNCQPCPYLKRRNGVWICSRPDVSFGIGNKANDLLCQSPGASPKQINECAAAVSDSANRRNRLGRGRRNERAASLGKLGADQVSTHHGDDPRTVERMVSGKRED